MGAKPKDWYSLSAGALPSVTQSSTDRAPPSFAQLISARTSSAPTPDLLDPGAVYIETSSTVRSESGLNPPIMPTTSPDTRAKKVV